MYYFTRFLPNTLSLRSGERARERSDLKAIDDLWARGERTKHQTPNIKHQISSKSQAPRQEACDRFWNLKVGISLEFGVWDLVFGAHSFVAGRGRRYSVKTALFVLWSILRTTH